MVKATTQAFLLCDEVSTVGKMNLVGLFDRIKNGSAKFHVVFRFSAEPGLHELRLTMRGPRGSEALYTGEIETKRRTHAHNHIISADFEIGQYVFTVYLDGRLMGTFELEAE